MVLRYKGEKKTLESENRSRPNLQPSDREDSVCSVLVGWKISQSAIVYCSNQFKANMNIDHYASPYRKGKCKR